MNFENTVLGLELGSTRIKAVLLDEHFQVLANGSYTWENQLIDGIWTYSLDEVHQGLQACYKDLKEEVKEKYGETIHSFKQMGISGMMHGYLPFDQEGKQLAEFRTWRNTITGEAAEKLTGLFGFNIPQRWSIAHLYQAILNKESHLPKLAHLTTLCGYIHYRLTGEYVLGIGEASGMFPIDSNTYDYDAEMMKKFQTLIEKDYDWKIQDVLPKVLVAGDKAGSLSKEGALFLDPEGDLEEGVPLCPPEGDAGTGMVATNSVAVHTGNVSAGTSDFAMLVVDHALGVHREIDMVTTPAGNPVAMVHCNNCTSDINAWVNLFKESNQLFGVEVDDSTLFTKLFEISLEGNPDCGGLLSYNYLSGEGITDLDEGRPVFVRKPNASFTLANFMRTHLVSAMATLKWGMKILTDDENVPIEKIYGHGGYFKTPLVGQRILSAALNAPVSVMETAGEGGPYGMALLAAYSAWKEEGESLADFLNHKVFADAKSVEIMASEEEVKGFDSFFEQYQKSFILEKDAVETISES